MKAFVAAILLLASAQSSGAQNRSASPGVLLAPAEAPQGSFRLSAQGTSRAEVVYGLDPKLAYNPGADEHLAVWTEIIDGERYVVAQRIGGSKEPIGDAVRLSAESASGSRPAVAFDTERERYLVTWLASGDTGDREIQVVLVNAGTGRAIGSPASLSEPRFARAPTVAYGYGDYLLVWQETDLQGASEIYSLILDGTEARAEGSKVRLSQTGADDLDARFDAVTPSVAFDGRAGNYVVVWASNGDEASTSPRRFGIVGRSLSATGVPESHRLRVAGGSDWDARWPSVAWSGDVGESFAVWTSQSATEVAWPVNGSRLSTGNGFVAGKPLPISRKDKERALHPSVELTAQTGSYVVAWESVVADKARTIAARVVPVAEAPAGDWLTTGLEDATFALHPGRPASATGSGGASLLAWSESGSGINVQPLKLETASSIAAEVPEGLLLTPGYPNPFRNSATVTLGVQDAQRVVVVLYDMLGRRVQTVFSGFLTENEVRELTLDGAQLPSGQYILEARGERFRKTVPLVRMR